MWLKWTAITTTLAFAYPPPVQTDKLSRSNEPQWCWNVNIKLGRTWRPSLDEEDDRERAICSVMKILQINILCYGNQMTRWMTAIGCGGEECSSRANGFCYQWLAAGKPIKKWKPTRGTGPWNRFYVGLILPARVEEERHAVVCKMASRAPLNFLRRNGSRY